MDKIYIRDLTLHTIIGVFAEERVKRQEVIFDLELSCDFSKAIASDDLADAVDYKTLKKRIIEQVENSSFQLIETLADSVARICLDTPGVEEVKVTLDKPGALRYARSVAVEITRKRSH